MNKLEEAKKVVKENLEESGGVLGYGIFNTRNIVGDPMVRIYSNNGLVIDVCYGYGYFEVFGLTTDEFVELENFYNNLCETR